MKRKIICLALILTLILPYAMVNISHGSGPNVFFSVNSQNAKKGEENIIVGVSLNSCATNFVAGNFELTYDSNVLEYAPYMSDGDVSYTQNYGPLIQNLQSTSVVINSNTEGKLKIGYMSQGNLVDQSGQIFLLRFNVKNFAVYGDSNIGLTATTLKDENGNDLIPSFTDGCVSVLSGITMNASTLQLSAGETGQLSVSSSDGTIFQDITWTSSNNNVASVVANSDSKIATVTANAAGTATITATLGDFTATCEVTVTQATGEYTIYIRDPYWTSLPRTQIRTLEVMFSPNSAADGKTLTWSSSDTSVATINSTTGKITAVKNGMTTITVTDGTKSATFTLNVDGMLGDVDDDDNITSYDAYKALEISTKQGNGTPLTSVDKDNIVKLDVERNDSISSNDAYLILKYSVGLITSFN